jgi:hypothetical protein
LKSTRKFAARVRWALVSNTVESIMKFVHLTPQPNIARIKQNGIRSGKGRRGRGVYAVPLMLMQRVSLSGVDNVVASEPRSSITLWQWLAETERGHRNLAAIVFRTTPDQWPAELYIELQPSVGTDWLTDIDSAQATVTDADLQFVRNAHRHTLLADLKLSIQSPSGLGRVLRAIQSRGHTTWDRYDESVEIIFPSPVAPNLIEQITPLYRTNKQFKRDRECRHGAE